MNVDVMVRTPSQSTALGFIDSTLAQIIERPGLWGSLHSVELQVLRLLEIRFVLAGGDTHESGVITRSYRDYLNENFPDASPRSMWGRIEETFTSLDEDQREGILRKLMGVFVEDHRRVQDSFVPRTAGPQKPEYHPDDDASRLSYLMEECAEVVHVGCKIQRFGWHGANPDLPPEDRKTNTDLLLHELGNASYAIDLMYRQLGARLPIPEE